MTKLACVVWLSVLVPAAGAQRQDARELTVRLFSTQAVTSLSIDASKAATMQLCDGCKSVSVPAALDVRVSTTDKHLLVDGKTVGELNLTGRVHTMTADGRTADAAGKWEIKVARDGLHVLLTLPSERYVMAVLQSEAGVDDGPESLKALAVVARSFALTHSDRHGVEGLCDSTHCQAARMGTVPARIRDAVRATAGETLWFGGTQVDGYFTQNCGGATDDAADVWGGAKKPWLRAHPDPFCQRQPAQWHVSVTREELTRSLGAQGYRFSGVVADVRVLSRDGSGRAEKIEVNGGGTSKKFAASALRFAVDRELGWNRLRSDWYSVHTNGRNIVFDGRGYGHGVGLCQAGAAEMAREGKLYREILAFYFSGAQARVNVVDEGWRAQEANGWTLRSLHPDADLRHAGDESWVRARQIWGEPTKVHPVVTVTPDTELFRQLTNEPGWALAATAGQSITLQSLAIVRTHGPLKVLLLHEFLHVIVEGESIATTPLWLREGLVEALAGEKVSAVPMSPDQVERTLQSAHTLREAQTGHAAAEALVQKLIARYGLESIRRWLRSGVPATVFASQ